jgi:hypothetical protein
VVAFNRKPWSPWTGARTLIVAGIDDWAFRKNHRYDRSTASQIEFATATPARMCADSGVLDRVTKMIRDGMEKVYSDKAAPQVGSNGSYAPPVVDSDPTTSVVVDGVLAVDYNSEIDRVKCEIAFHVNGTEPSNIIAMLQGQGPQRKVAYFVQPDGTGELAISWLFERCSSVLSACGSFSIEPVEQVGKIVSVIKIKVGLRHVVH